MRLPVISRGVCLLLPALIVPSSASGQDAIELKVSLSTLTSNARSNAPISLKVQLESWSYGLLEGYLELTGYDERNLLYHHRSPELVLSAGERVSRTILPPLALRKDLSQLTVQARFVTKAISHDLGTFQLRVPVHWRRSFVIGVVHPDETAFPDIGRDLGDVLRIDRFDRGDLREIGASSLASVIVPDDLRADALGLFSFDILAVSGQGFAELRPDQLDAIGQWVEAGGSLALVVDRTPSGAQAEFLTRITHASDNSSPVPGDSEPWAESEFTLPVESRLCRAGLGRAVIFPGVPEEEPEIREAVSFLWKLRSDRLPRFLETGRIDVPEPPSQQATGWQWNNSNPYLEHRPFRPVRSKELDRMSALLLPESVQGVPLAVVLSVLALFLIAIVPLDYLILGYLKRRRYTWILLPVLSLGFTGFTVWLGNSYLGSTDYRTSLEFIDLSTENHVLRSSRFELLFCATQREVSTEVKHGLHTSVPTQRIPDEDEWNSPSNMMSAQGTATAASNSDDQPAFGVFTYDGNMPSAFSVRKPMRQWTPELSRQTALESTTEVPPYPWDTIGAILNEESIDMKDEATQAKLLQAVHSVTRHSHVLLFNTGQVYYLSGERSSNGTMNGPGPADSRERHLMDLVRVASVRPSTGLFSIVSQLSPNGAANLEDLTLLDPSEPALWLMVVVNSEGDDYVVFRHLFQGVTNGIRFHQ